MTITQLYLAIGVPMVFNGALILLVYQALNQRISDLRADITSRVDGLHGDVVALAGKVDILTGKVVEIDNRLTRVETKLHIE